MIRLHGPARLGVTKALRDLAPVGDAAIDALLERTVERAFDAGAWLLRAGERAEWCFLIARGLVRELYVDEAGQEHTRSFLAEGHVTGSLLDLLSGAPSITWIQALEPTATLAWRYRDFNALAERFAELHVVARRQAEGLYVRKTRREHEMLALSASERYTRWLASHRGLDARVSRRHLASYLGVSPEHLSRLRRAR
jgi:CRP/FNR family transcriptional regulator, anaerobic regulatory protein